MGASLRYLRFDAPFGFMPLLALSTTVCALVLPGGLHRAAQGRAGPRSGCATMKLQGNEERGALEERNSIVDQPGRAGRFRDTLSNFEADADWLGFIGNRVLDAVDDSLHRESYLDDDNAPSAAKKRVVVLGSGWGANAVLSQLKNANCDVQVVSPRNYFLFTPMLAGAALALTLTLTLTLTPTLTLTATLTLTLTRRGAGHARAALHHRAHTRGAP